MGSRLIAIAAVAVVGAFALAACGGGAGESAGEPDAPTPAAPADEGQDSGTSLAGDPHPEQQFVGMTLDAAIAFAEEQAREWRIGRQDGEALDLTADLVPGRVTFTVEDGIVTEATIEEDEEVVLPPEGVEDESRAQLLARAVERLVTVDNTFGGGSPFDRIEVATVIGGNPEQPVEPLALELIAAAIQPHARVEFIPDAQAAIDTYFEGAPEPVAVISVDDVRVEGERAEIDLALWCGSLCGTWLTYEATLGPDGWEILGTTGPVAIS